MFTENRVGNTEKQKEEKRSLVIPPLGYNMSKFWYGSLKIFLIGTFFMDYAVQRVKVGHIVLCQ